MKITSTRQMIQIALGAAYPGDTGMAELLDYLTRIQHTQNTGLEKMVADIQLAKIRAAINDQKQPIPAWLHFSYGPDLESAQKSRQLRTVALMLAAGLTPSAANIKKRERIERLCYCAVEDYRLGLFLGKTLPQVAYAEAMGVHPNHWDRDWGRIQDAALGRIRELDADGIGRVSVTVREIREAEEVQ
jgi:hypothetical protein